MLTSECQHLSLKQKVKCTKYTPDSFQLQKTWAMHLPVIMIWWMFFDTCVVLSYLEVYTHGFVCWDMTSETNPFSTYCAAALVRSWLLTCYNVSSYMQSAMCFDGERSMSSWLCRVKTDLKADGVSDPVVLCSAHGFSPALCLCILPMPCASQWTWLLHHGDRSTPEMLAHSSKIFSGA